MSKKEIKKCFEEKVELNNLPIKKFKYAFDHEHNIIKGLKNLFPEECFDWYSLKFDIYTNFIDKEAKKKNPLCSHLMRNNKDEVDYDIEINSNSHIAYFDDNIIYFTISMRSIYAANNYSIQRLLFKKKKYLKKFLIKVLYDFEKNEEERKKKKEKRREKQYNRVFLKNNKKEDIFNEIEDFINSKELYEDDLDLPWKRGYCLYGPPGNGKTLLIRTIKNYFGLTTHDLLDCINSDGSLDIGYPMEKCSSTIESPEALYNSLFPKQEKPDLYYLEDIDRAMAESNSRDSSSIQTHQLLKALDGVERRDKVILFVTTNKMDDVVKPLSARPGRIDREIEIGEPNKNQIKKLFDHYDIKVNKRKKLINELYGKSMAFAEELIKSAKMKYKRKEFEFDELKKILERIGKHNQSFGEDVSVGGFTN